MKIRLVRDVPKLGRAGEVLTVGDAYARNFLLPKGLGQIATAAHIAQAATQQARQAQSVTKRRSNWSVAQAQLANREIHLSAEANPKGTLFASLKADAVRQHLTKLLKLDLTDVRFEPDHWKTTGQHPVTLSWPDEKQQTITLIIDHGD